MRTAVYAGTFDPITLGHLDVIERALKAFDKVIVGVAARKEKNCLFTLKERVEMAQTATKPFKNVEVKGFDGLLVGFAKKNRSKIILRGLRAVSDFDFEFQSASANRKLAPDIESVFIMTNEKYFYLSSSMVKEIARLGGSINCFVPEAVAKKVREKLK